MGTKKLLIMAGGTGGHVFPGLAIAAYLKKMGMEIHWLGTKNGFEASIIPDLYPFHTIEIAGVRGHRYIEKAKSPFKILKAIYQASIVIKNISPDLIIGLGGFASGPGGIASWFLKRPLVIHEQNAKAGLTNQILTRFSKRVLSAFPETFKPSVHEYCIGNPVRDEINVLPRPSLRFKDKNTFNLLVLGGSLGADAINRIVPEALAMLDENERPNVVHQAGSKHLTKTIHAYEERKVKAEVKPFISDMALAYLWADFVVARAGALTISELCTVGLPAILIPYPFAVDDHQTKNAQYMVQGNAALCFQQRDFKAAQLAAIVRDLKSKEKRLEMSEAAFSLRKENVVEKFYEICQEVLS